MSRALIRKAVLVGAVFFLFQPATPPLAAATAAPGTPRTQKERESYSIGYRFGIGMKHDGVEVDIESLFRGMRDAVDGKGPVLANDEMKSLLLELKKRARETAMRNLQELTVRNAEEAVKFLEENGKKEGIVTTESGLQYKVLKQGGGALPGPEDLVRVQYRGTFIDGSEFDNSYGKDGPQTVQADGVIKGWTEALRLMRAGSKWQIFVPPHLAYGRSGLGQKIPPNKLLVFDIELLSVDTLGTKEDGK